jgi:CRISPR-associated protein Cmr5
MSEEKASMQKTIEQKRAKAAWEDVARAKEKGKDFGGKYKRLAQKMPAYILTNGLGQSLAFLKSKAKGKDGSSKEHELLYEHLSKWVMQQVDPKGNQSLLQWVMDNDSISYRRATTEVLAFLAWLKRFAEAELENE